MVYRRRRYMKKKRTYKRPIRKSYFRKRPKRKTAKVNVKTQAQLLRVQMGGGQNQTSYFYPWYYDNAQSLFNIMSEPYTKACMKAYEYYRPTGIKFTYTPAYGSSN